MTVRLPFRNLIPTFFSGLLDDPVLLLRTRSSGRHLMFDCGQIHHLAKRIFTRLDAIFISHAHMDHWMGIDSVIRHLIATKRTLEIFGPPGLIDKFEYKLRGYDWNLMEDYWCSFRVYDIGSEQISSAFFSGPDGFTRRNEGARDRGDRTVYRTNDLEVRAEICDHRLDSIIYRIEERPDCQIDRERLSAQGLTAGPWLAELKHYYLNRRTAMPGHELWRQAEMAAGIDDPEALLRAVIVARPGRSIGYISDIAYHADNHRRVVGLLEGVDLLLCECTYLCADEQRARSADHLCVRDVNRLLQDLQPRFFAPMHLSRSYSRRHKDLYRELQPPALTQLLEIPLRVTPRPLLSEEIDWITPWQAER